MSNSKNIKRYEDQLTGIVAAEDEWQIAYTYFLQDYPELNYNPLMRWNTDLREVNDYGRYK